MSGYKLFRHGSTRKKRNRQSQPLPRRSTKKQRFLLIIIRVKLRDELLNITEHPHGMINGSEVRDLRLTDGVRNFVVGILEKWHGTG